jgi:hypothetical protein
MIAPVLIAASVALISLQTDGECFPPEQPIVVQRAGGIVYRIYWPAGAMRTGSTDDFAAFAGFGRLHVNDVPYLAKDLFCPDDLVDSSKPESFQTILAPPTPLRLPDGNAVLVSRKIYIPISPNDQSNVRPQGYARYYDRIRNVSGVPITINVRFSGNLGGNLLELVERRNGFAVIRSDFADVASRDVGILFERGFSDPDDVEPIGVGISMLRPWLEIDLARRFLASHYEEIKLAPGQEIAIVNFVTYDLRQYTTSGDPNAESIDATEPVGAGPSQEDVNTDLEELGKKPDFDNLSDEETDLIINMFADTDINMDGCVNILDMIIVRNDLGKDPASGTANPRSDVNADASINILDMILVRNDLGWPF